MRLRLALFRPICRPIAALAIAMSLTGCIEIIEGNIKAFETLANDEATSRDKGFATAVVAGTLTAVTALAIAVTVTATTDWSPDDPPPKDYVASQLGWGLERKGDEVSWRRCTSRIFCTEECVTMPAADVLSTSPIGRVVPFAMGGHALDEVDLLELKVHHHN